jgi:hypothetical protein
LGARLSQMKLFKLMLIALLFFVSATQSSLAEESDILDFMPAILAAGQAHKQVDLEGIWYTENRYFFIDDTGKLINVEPIAGAIIYDFSGSFTVDIGKVTGTINLDDQPLGGIRNMRNIIYSGFFVNQDEIEMDWDVPNVDSGKEIWRKVPYTGNTVQAVITGQNALELAQNTWIVTDVGGKLPVFYIEGPENPGFFITEDGLCGGTAAINGQKDAQGFFYGTLTYNDFCGEDFTYDGYAEFLGETDLVNNAPLYFLYDFFDISITNEDGLFTFNGIKGSNFMGPPSILLMSYVLVGGGLDKSYWINELELEYLEINNFEISAANGRFYDPEFGYVELSVEGLIQINVTDRWPSSGAMILTGAQGGPGGRTKARLTFLNATEFLVEADTDGDGAYDDYNSGPQLW